MYDDSSLEDNTETVSRLDKNACLLLAVYKEIHRDIIEYSIHPLPLTVCYYKVDIRHFNYDSAYDDYVAVN